MTPGEEKFHMKASRLCSRVSGTSQLFDLLNSEGNLCHFWRTHLTVKKKRLNIVSWHTHDKPRLICTVLSREAPIQTNTRDCESNFLDWTHSIWVEVKVQIHICQIWILVNRLSVMKRGWDQKRTLTGGSKIPQCDLWGLDLPCHVFGHTLVDSLVRLPSVLNHQRPVFQQVQTTVIAHV